MSKIVLYDQPDCKGNWKELTDSVSNLECVSFSQTARSLKVEGKHWVAYKDNDLKGDFMVYGPGEHNHLGSMDSKIVSVRLVKEELGNPDIVLYEDAHFEGQSRNIIVLVDDLKIAGFKNPVSSHKVKQGVWILYADLHLKGRRMITFKGENCPDCRQFHWNDKLSSLKPLLNRDHEV
ncbi:epidermal differentiation-specific protein-like [Mustelus asterias]